MSLALYAVEVAARLTINTVYYGTKGLWWITRRAIWGRPKSAEERQQQILERQERIIQAQDSLATSCQQEELIEAMHIQLEQQAEVLRQLESQRRETTVVE